MTKQEFEQRARLIRLLQHAGAPLAKAHALAEASRRAALILAATPITSNQGVRHDV